MARTIIGTVTSDASDKSIVVTLVTRETHPLYGKKFTRSRKYHAHDEKNEAHVGDTVEIAETRPISKKKSWTLSRIVERGHEAVEIKEEEIIAEQKAAKDAVKAEIDKTDKEAA